MEELLRFLRDLYENNDRQWFSDNKDRYRKARETWNEFVVRLIAEVGKFDADIARLTLRDCTYRIYRDTRFSQDKRPYKTHFGAFLAKEGKKSMHAGYYFHIGTGLADTYPHAHMFAIGNYCYDMRAIKVLREDISAGWHEFRRDVLDKADPRLRPDMDNALKRVPREYPADAPYADWMRMRSYCLSATVDDDYILADGLEQRVAERMRTAKPFVDYINRAVDYVREEM